jgi:hypothetical protein
VISWLGQEDRETSINELVTAQRQLQDELNEAKKVLVRATELESFDQKGLHAFAFDSQISRADEGDALGNCIPVEWRGWLQDSDLKLLHLPQRDRVRNVVIQVLQAEGTFKVRPVSRTAVTVLQKFVSASRCLSLARQPLDHQAILSFSCVP